MTDQLKQPVFITLDGIDGVGKSTQMKSLTDCLEQLGHRVLALRDPGTTPIGQELRGLLLNSELEMHRRTEAMLFMASRCEMIETTIRPALADGISVISDRFLLANVVYQSIGGDVSANQLWEMGRWANANLQPDLTLLLDMPAQNAMQRISGPADRMESRGVDYLESVRQAFLSELPNSGQAFEVIDADRPAAEVSFDMINRVKAFLNA